MKEKQSKHAPILVVVLIVAIGILIAVNQPHKSASDDPIYQGQLQAEKMLREDRAVLVKIVR